MKITILISLVFLLNLQGCISVGKKFDQTKTTEIKTNITTQKDIIKIFGEPDSVGFSNNILIFEYLSITGSSLSLSGKRLYVVFNENNTVKEYSFYKMKDN
ncbi:hypothetical protein QEJ31_12910 [Pigmentibacter sp. JX0631]|uniref:hypothetical protein n=1 Tax=Pigmentibacter sp. JX0631 TaxID=2976982 RepID=UPI002469BDF9|nr:hypothetical protein [Pigmentibacter sp. JX0631]WGL59424.1 hypothetical protein QEJ31_12910 [Pigmentibacter sp. JX0631]